jgi:Contractile injection system tube protein/LysM domain
VPRGTSLTVDFNPSSLALTHHSIGPRGKRSIRSDQTVNMQALEQTGFAISLSLDLVFDSTSDGTSVQLKTEKLAELAKPYPLDGNKPPPAKVIRFSWGEFLFYGSITSMTQTLTFFSEWGTPLRAEIHLSLDGVEKQGDPGLFSPVNLSAGPVSVSFGENAPLAATAAALIAASAAPAGTTAYAQSQAGDTVSAITSRSSSGASWKSVAAANGIDNPRLLPPGTVIDPNATVQH